ASPERRSHHHRRTDSVASIQSAASISSINIEETRTTTGVTLDDIAIHIRGPDVADGKWECVFDGCGKRFGRKENIKSHVQTHLNDRQYQCPSCAKCFVRQHDLKRHAKIHSGVKAYGCECGNSFARHDALTRHKQRGMCVGAFDGVVRKVVKRGRPRKHRPDMDERTDKSARTRKKNMSVSSVSSGFSDASSGAGSPRNEFDVVMGNGFDAMDVAFDMGTLRGMPPVIRPRAAPELQGYANSPESAVSYVSPGAIMEQGGALPSHPASPAKSTTSHYAEPPGLSQSSSPPACHLFESDASQPADGMPQFPAAPQQHQHQSLPAAMMGGLAEQDEDLMKTFTHGEGLVPVDRDPGMFGVSEFDREYAASMMNADDDLFFGTG
ncbi:hypothetical protein IMZ48_42090, partial [Candidatus Bathyarchaeota archaeon]|nr:hypothetical protein [Candidatus Bathyarchaeota archaeon]